MPSACEPFRTFIESQLRLRRNYSAIYQDLIDQFGFTARSLLRSCLHYRRRVKVEEIINELVRMLRLDLIRLKYSSGGSL
jgi:hypothetical protein